MEERNHARGRSAVVIVHALLWAAAILAASYILRDESWAKYALFGALALFSVSNGLLVNRSKSRTGR